MREKPTAAEDSSATPEDADLLREAFAGVRRLTAQELDLIQRWYAGGAPAVVGASLGGMTALLTAGSRILEGKTVHAIPMSALEGDNVTVASDRTPWFTGPSLLEYLETADVETGVTEKPLTCRAVR